MKRPKKIKLVLGRAFVPLNQTGSGKHGDRRTKRKRARDARERAAIKDQDRS